MRFFSAEWMLDRPSRRANGGGVILLRSAWIALWLVGLAVLLYELVGAPYTLSVSLGGVGRAAVMGARWFAVVFGFAYATLAARFASQWRYLADLYNQIKAAEVGAASDPLAKDVLIEWKAGFVEDAQVLHLVTKPIFASVITAWADDVRDEFIRNCGGPERFERIVVAAREAASKQLAEEGAKSATAP